MSNPSRTLKSLERASKILEILRRNGDARLSDIGEELEISLSTVHIYLNTLQEHDLVERDGNRYDLGPELLTLGETYRNNSILYQAGRSEIKRLASETEEAVHLIIERNNRAMTLYEEFGSRAVGTNYHEQWREETHAYLHCTGSGKAILAHLPDERIERILQNQELVELTSDTITDADELRAELQTIREQGYALADGEEISGVRAVGVPIRPEDDEVLGAISLTAAANRLEEARFHDRIPSRLQQAANVIEVNINTGDWRPYG